MIKFWLIRHGMTEGNRHGRYIGVTDEPLCPEGRSMLDDVSYPVPQMVFSSPLIRCRETAGILFPEKEPYVIMELAECDFGDFENKNYKELSGNAEYQAWIDSNGTLPFPGGESRAEFRARSLTGFEKAVQECIREHVACAALVIHGGTIMNIMEEYGSPARSFYEWHVKNGGGYLVELDETEWQNGRRRLNLYDTVMEG
ncbi:MAG: histidine phosphatase family protein [Eubacteriales bacterium]|nr:histidine phosphatase family protein [Eubacteriales bacterium]